MDVNASLDELHAAAKKAVDIYGRVDVIVNNAGYIEPGTIEEITLVFRIHCTVNTDDVS